MGYKFNIFTKKFDLVEPDGSSGDVLFLVGDDGTPVGPNGSGEIDVLGLPDIYVDGNAGTNTLTLTDLTKITPYVVDNTLTAGTEIAYSTIQSALDAANAAGGGAIYIRQGTYNENLTLYDQCNLISVPGISQGVNQGVLINGTHTPPLTGHVVIDSICLVSTTDVFFSNAAGTAHIQVANCESAVQNGYLFNLPNWTSSDSSNGILEIYDCNPDTSAAPWSINDGGIFNTGGAQIVVYNTGVGNGTNVMTISGSAIFGQAVTVGCPLTCSTDSNVLSIGSQYEGTVTLNDNSIFQSYNDSYVTGNNQAISMNSSGELGLYHSTIDSTNSPAIGGVGVGTIKYADLTFPNNNVIQGGLITDPVSWKPYATAGDTISGVRGTAAFDSTKFTVIDGFVTLTGIGTTWIDQGTSITLSSNTGYFVTAATTQTLPAAPSQGDVIKIICDTTGAVVVTANAGQTIRLGNQASSTAGTFTSTQRGDGLELVYRAATTQWLALNSVGAWAIA